MCDAIKGYYLKVGRDVPLSNTIKVTKGRAAFDSRGVRCAQLSMCSGVSRMS